MGVCVCVGRYAESRGGGIHVGFGLEKCEGACLKSATFSDKLGMDTSKSYGLTSGRNPSCLGDIFIPLGFQPMDETHSHYSITCFNESSLT